METIIKLEDICLSYKTKFERVDVLNNLNIEFNKNEFAIVVGPSGIGKSSLLNLISGFLKPNRGRVLVMGEDISRFNEKEICYFRNKKIGYVFQFFNLIQQFNVRENIEVPLILSGNDKKEIQIRVEELLDLVGLKNRAKHYPEELSGGEQQRVAIARALANNPDIILADEPTGNLDKKNSEKILELFKQIHEDGKTIIMVTHDMSICKLATRTYDFEKII